MYIEKENNTPNCIPNEQIGPDKPLCSCGIMETNHPSVAEKHEIYFVYE